MSEERHIRSCLFPAAPLLAKSAFQTWIQLRWKQKSLFLVWSIYKGSFRRTQSWHFTIHIPVIRHTIASWHSYGLIMTFECIKNTSGKANNFKNQILPMWSYNVNCWAGSTSAAFLSAIASASPAAKVEDKTNIQGFWLSPGDKLTQLTAPRTQKMMLLVFLHPTFLTETLKSFKYKQRVPYWACLCFPTCQWERFCL